MSPPPKTEAGEDRVNAGPPFDELRRHRTIGWDLDLTLIGHPASPAMHDFIRATPEIRHLIVTFRSHGAQNHIWSDLAGVDGAPPPSCFAGVVNIDDAIVQAFRRINQHRTSGHYTGPLSPAEALYRSWKGRMCAQWGATILIDDMTEYVALGCTLHGIELLHPNRFGRF